MKKKDYILAGILLLTLLIIGLVFYVFTLPDDQYGEYLYEEQEYFYSEPEVNTMDSQNNDSFYMPSPEELEKEMEEFATKNNEGPYNISNIEKDINLLEDSLKNISK